MKVNFAVCDYCHKICDADYYQVFRNRPDGNPQGVSEYCSECWAKAHTNLPTKPFDVNVHLVDDEEEAEND